MLVASSLAGNYNNIVDLLGDLPTGRQDLENLLRLLQRDTVHHRRNLRQQGLPSNHWIHTVRAAKPLSQLLEISIMHTPEVEIKDLVEQIT